jgi:hypothetical protein
MTMRKSANYKSNNHKYSGYCCLLCQYHSIHGGSKIRHHRSFDSPCSRDKKIDQSLTTADKVEMLLTCGKTQLSQSAIGGEFNNKDSD